MGPSTASVSRPFSFISRSNCFLLIFQMLQYATMALQGIFDANDHPNQAEVELIAELLGVKTKQVSTWVGVPLPLFFLFSHQ